MRFFGSKVERLAERGDVDGLSRLVLVGRDADTRRLAVEALGGLGDQRAVAVLITMLHRWGSADQLRESASEALRRLGPIAVPSLASALQDTAEETSFRDRVAELLGAMGTPEANEAARLYRVERAEARDRLKAADRARKVGERQASDEKAHALAADDRRELARRVHELVAREGISSMEAARRVREEDHTAREEQRRQDEERRVEELRSRDPRAWAGMQADRLLQSADVRPEEMAPLLVLLYDAHLGGEREGFAEWTSNYRAVRKIGERLHELGGFALMLETHRRFAEARPRGGARNLEMAWDGIGDWRG